MIKKVVFILLTLNLIMFTLESCCTEQHGKIAGLAGSQISPIQSSSFEFDEDLLCYVVNGPFSWGFSGDAQLVSSANTSQYAAYATQPCGIESWVNDFDSTSFKVFFTDEFSYQQNTIRDSTNIYFLIDSWSEQDLRHIISFLNLSFDSTFISRSEFDTNHVYTLHFEGFTTDSIALADSVKIRFDFN